MQTMDSLASCLIKTRTRNIGFPSLFSHCPDGMERETLKDIHEYVLTAMKEVQDIPKSSGYIRKIVIGTGRYLVLGISGYINYLAAEVPDIPYELVDIGGRSIAGFVGFVWDLERNPLPKWGFPALSDFDKVLNEHIITHWEEPDNSPWSNSILDGKAVPYQYAVSMCPFSADLEDMALNDNKMEIRIFHNDKTEALLQQAVVDACKKKTVSFCTDLYLDRTVGNCFLNMTAVEQRGAWKEVDNQKYVQQIFVQRNSDKRNNISDKEEYLKEDTEAESNENRKTEIYIRFKCTKCGKTEDVCKKFLQQLEEEYKNSNNKIKSQSGWISSGEYRCQLSFDAPITIEDFEKKCRETFKRFQKEGIIIMDGRTSSYQVQIGKRVDFLLEYYEDGSEKLIDNILEWIFDEVPWNWHEIGMNPQTSNLERISGKRSSVKKNGGEEIERKVLGTMGIETFLKKTSEQSRETNNKNNENNKKKSQDVFKF